MSWLAKYRWKITVDHWDGDSVGTEGPSNLDPLVGTNPEHFSLWDDDGNCMAEGMIYGDYSGFEPLDEFGEGNWGCTQVKIEGEWL